MTDPDFGSLDWDAALDAEKDLGGGIEPIPAGPYTVKATKVDAVPYSTGSIGLKVTLTIVGGPYDGRLVWTNLVWKGDNPKSTGMFTRKCMAFGLTREWLSTARPSMQQIANELVGRSATAKVAVKEYKGRQTNDVTNLDPLSPGTPAGGTVPAPPIPTAAPTPTVPPAPSVPAPPAVSEVPPLPDSAATGTAFEATDEEPFVVDVVDFSPEFGFGSWPKRLLP